MGRSGEVLTVKLGGRAIHVMQPPQPEPPAFIREEFALAFEIIPPGRNAFEDIKYIVEYV
jgi:hypothetical protein